MKLTIELTEEQLFAVQSALASVIEEQSRYPFFEGGYAQLHYNALCEAQRIIYNTERDLQCRKKR